MVARVSGNAHGSCSGDAGLGPCAYGGLRGRSQLRSRMRTKNSEKPRLMLGHRPGASCRRNRFAKGQQMCRDEEGRHGPEGRPFPPSAAVGEEITKIRGVSPPIQRRREMPWCDNRMAMPKRALTYIPPTHTSPKSSAASTRLGSEAAWESDGFRFGVRTSISPRLLDGSVGEVAVMRSGCSGGFRYGTRRHHLSPVVPTAEP
jgi:hypothetical protein